MEKVNLEKPTKFDHANVCQFNANNVTNAKSLVIAKKEIRKFYKNLPL